MTWTEGITLAIIGAVVSIATSLVATGFQGWKWRTGEQPSTITDTSIRLVTEMRKQRDDDRAEFERERIADRAELDTMRQELRDLRAEVEKLRGYKDLAERRYHQIKAMGGTPVE